MTSDAPGAALVAGDAGFIDSNLADWRASAGHRVIVLDNPVRPGAEHNAAWLRGRHGDQINFVRDDIRDRPAVEVAVAQAEAVFYLAVQVAVTTSPADPRQDFGVNVEGTLALLEALRRKDRPTPLAFASTTKLCGDLGDIELTREADGCLLLDANLTVARKARPTSMCSTTRTASGCPPWRCG
jgi:CDP-paratose 2-epimerase